MDWIERWFGISPDNGDGSLEWLIVLVMAVALAGVALRWHPGLRGRLTAAIAHLLPSSRRQR